MNGIIMDDAWTMIILSLVKVAAKFYRHLQKMLANFL